MFHERRRGGEAPGPGQSEVRAQDGAEALDGEQGVAGAVIPVAGPFRIDPVRRIGRLHHVGQVGDGALDDGGGQDRLVLVKDEGTGHHPAVADLGPVGGAADPAVVPEGGGEAQVDDCPAGGFAGFRCQRRMQPVVADGDRQGHLGHVEKLLRIPIAEPAQGAQFSLASVGIPVIAGHLPEGAQGQHPGQGLAGDAQQLLVIQDPFQGRLA